MMEISNPTKKIKYNYNHKNIIKLIPYNIRLNNI